MNMLVKIGAPLVLATAVAAAGCGGDRHETTVEAAAAAPLDVQAQPVARRDIGPVVEVGGVVRARTTAVVASRLLAPVRDVLVTPGDRVRAGQLLVRLDDRDLSAQARQAQAGGAAAEQAVAAMRADLESARAALTLARASHARIAALGARKSATAHELDEATAALAGAESRAAAAESRLRQAEAGMTQAQAGRDVAVTTAGFALVTAPFAGIVTEKHVESGNMVTPGQPLVTVEDTAAFRLDVRLDESRLPALAPGARVPVHVHATDGEAAGLVLEGTVTEVGRAIDAGVRSARVKIALPVEPRPRGAGQTLRSGMFARARFAAGTRQAVTVPASALVRQGQMTSVYVIDNGVARQRLVSIGTTPADGSGPVEILAGVEAGELVVTTPSAGLFDGRKVRTGGRS